MFYVAFDLGLGVGSWLYGLALQLGGVQGMYVSAAIVAAAALPFACKLGSRGAAAYA
jgi:hypothetical protein